MEQIFERKGARLLTAKPEPLTNIDPSAIAGSLIATAQR
jgi:hypothetical protein